MYRIYFGFLVAIFCSGVNVFANTLENQPNHREIGEAVNTQLKLRLFDWK